MLPVRYPRTGNGQGRTADTARNQHTTRRLGASDMAARSMSYGHSPRVNPPSYGQRVHQREARSWQAVRQACAITKRCAERTDKLHREDGALAHHSDVRVRARQQRVGDERLWRRRDAREAAARFSLLTGVLTKQSQQRGAVSQGGGGDGAPVCLNHHSAVWFSTWPLKGTLARRRSAGQRAQGRRQAGSVQWASRRKFSFSASWQKNRPRPDV